MFRNILVPIVFDHDDAHRKALEVAATLRDPDGAITVLHVLEEVPGWVRNQLPDGILEKTRDEVVESVNEIAAGAGANCTGKVISGHSGRTIVDYAGNHENDCIVITSHRPGLQDYFLGSTAAMVTRHAGCSVVVLR